MKGNIDKEKTFGKTIDEVLKVAKYVAMYTHVYTPCTRAHNHICSYLLYLNNDYTYLNNVCS